MPELVLGPVLRYVGIDAATVWVETDAPCQVEVLGHRERTFTVEGHHYALVCIRDLAPGQDIPYDVGLDGRRVWPPPDHPSPQPALRVIYSGAGPMRRTGPVAAVLLLVVVGVSAFFALRPSDPSPRMSSDRASSDGEEGFRAQRRDMVESQIAARGLKDRRVLAAMTAAPRHEFVPRAHVERAYSDGPLPIGFGQTISQPYIVALMTELAQVRKGDSVLEIGTGSGYQAAVLAELTDRVYSVEIVPGLARDAPSGSSASATRPSASVPPTAISAGRGTHPSTRSW